MIDYIKTKICVNVKKNHCAIRHNVGKSPRHAQLVVCPKGKGKCQGLSEEQQVAIDIQGVSPPGGTSLMGESQRGKALRPQTAECVLLLLCLHMFTAAVFLWYLCESGMV